MPLSPNLTIPNVYTQRISVTNWTPADGTLIVEVYVNSTTGSDTNSGTSPTDAFLTIQRAVESNVFCISVGLTVRINLAGAADHVIESGYEFPMVISPDGLTTAPDELYGFTQQAPLVIRSTPTLLETLATSDIDQQNINANTLLNTLETNNTYTVNQFKGKFLVDALGTIASIASNTVSNIVTTAPSTLTTPIKIYNYGATIVPSDLTALHPVFSIRNGSGPVVVQGCNIEGTTDGYPGNAVCVSGGAQMILVACAFDGLSQGDEFTSLSLFSNASVTLYGTYGIGDWVMTAGPLLATNSAFEDCSFLSVTASVLVSIGSAIFTTCGPLFWSAGIGGSSSSTFIGILVEDAVSNAIRKSGGLLSVSGAEINGAADAAFLIENNAYATLEFFEGTGNAGGGLLVNSGAQVKTDASSVINVGQTSPISAGANAATTWAAYHTAGEEVDATSELCRIFEGG